MMKRFSSFVPLLCSFLWCARAAGGAVPASEIRVAMAQELTSLNPLLSVSALDGYVASFVYRADLVVRDGDQSWRTQAAQRVPSLENGDVSLLKEGGRTKMKVVWRIRPEARWADGAPLVAADYRLGWETARNSNVGSALDRSGLEAVERFEISPGDVRKFTLVYAKPRYDFLHVAPLAIPRHIEESIYQKHKGEKEGYDRNSLYVKAPLTKGLYCGPWVVREHKPGSHLLLERNENYWGQKPKTDRIVLRFLENTQAVEMALLSGEIHMANAMGIGFDQALALERRASDSLEVEWLPGAVFEHIVFPLDNPLFSDVRVRQAIAHAVDRETLVRSLFGGRFPVAHQFLTPRDPWFPSRDSGVVEYPFSVRSAERLLEASGWSRGSDGIRTKNGRRLSFPYVTTSGNKHRETVQAFVQAALKRVGIEAVVKNVPARVLFGEVLAHRTMEGLVQFARDDWSESSPREFVHSKLVPTKENSFIGENISAWRNPEVDGWVEELENELSPEKRKMIAGKIAAAYSRELPALPLFFRSGAVVHSKRLSGFSIKDGTLGAENWALRP